MSARLNLTDLLARTIQMKTKYEHERIIAEMLKTPAFDRAVSCLHMQGLDASSGLLWTLWADLENRIMHQLCDDCFMRLTALRGIRRAYCLQWTGFEPRSPWNSE